MDVQFWEPGRELDRAILRSVLEKLYRAREALERASQDSSSCAGEREAVEGAKAALCRAIRIAEEQID